MDLVFALFFGFCLLVGLVYIVSWISSKPSRSKRDQIADENQSETANTVEHSKQGIRRTKDQKKSETENTSESKKYIKTDIYESDAELYKVLRDWRDQVARDRGVSKRKIFSDQTLDRIVDKKPLNKSALRYTKGVGPIRSERYGDGVLSILPNQEKENHKRRQKKIKSIIETEAVEKIYHFTDKDNLSSIRVNGGLYSWSHCENNDIHIARPGGNQVSRNLDRENGLEDYVRLSFVKKPPMYHVAKRDGRIQNSVVLEISPEVVLWESTLFSDGNAIANRAKIGGEPQDLSQIRFDILRQSNWTTESEKHYWQAEVLVKNHVPLRYMSNYL
jgi:hypothetical protein